MTYPQLNPAHPGWGARNADMSSTHTSLHYHFVFSTKHREPWFSATDLPRLHAYLGGVVRGLGGKPHAVGGVADHVHLLAGLKPTLAVADVMRQVKADSSKWIRQEWHRAAFSWQEGYGAFTVGAGDLERVRAYVLGQEDHHRVRTFQEEYVAMLQRGLVIFDDAHLW